jgi:hypothetical protein
LKAEIENIQVYVGNGLVLNIESQLALVDLEG